MDLPLRPRNLLIIILILVLLLAGCITNQQSKNNEELSQNSTNKTNNLIDNSSNQNTDTNTNKKDIENYTLANVEDKKLKESLRKYGENVRKNLIKNILRDSDYSKKEQELINFLAEFESSYQLAILEQIYTDKTLSDTELENIKVLVKHNYSYLPTGTNSPYLNLTKLDWDGDVYKNSRDRHLFEIEDWDGDGIPNKNVDLDNDGKAEIIGESDLPGSPKHANRYYYVCTMKGLELPKETKETVKLWWEDKPIKNPNGKTGVKAIFLEKNCSMEYKEEVLKYKTSIYPDKYKPENYSENIVFLSYVEEIPEYEGLFKEPSNIMVEKPKKDERAYTTLLHEDGHLIGLNHTDKKLNIMNPGGDQGLLLTEKQLEKIKKHFNNTIVSTKP